MQPLLVFKNDCFWGWVITFCFVTFTETRRRAWNNSPRNTILCQDLRCQKYWAPWQEILVSVLTKQGLIFFNLIYSCIQSRVTISSSSLHTSQFVEFFCTYFTSLIGCKYAADDLWISSCAKHHFKCAQLLGSGLTWQIALNLWILSFICVCIQ